MTVDRSVKLAAAAGWSVLAEFETVTAQRPDGARWEIGWMYGNPEAALITWENTYAVVVGCGMIVADLRRFGEPVGRPSPSPAGRSARDVVVRGRLSAGRWACPAGGRRVFRAGGRV